MVFDHVVFDLDGTLVDSRADLVSAVNHGLRVVGRPERDAQTLVGFIGEGARMLVERALGPDHQDALTAALEAFMDHYGAHLLDETRPYPGIAEALEALATRGVALSVLTNKPAGMSRAILEGLGLASRFVEVVGGDSLPTRKPHPAGLARLCALTGTPPGRALVVGDSAIDVRTARAAGVPVCGVGWGLAPGQLFAARPDWLVAAPAAVVTLVEGR